MKTPKKGFGYLDLILGLVESRNIANSTSKIVLGLGTAAEVIGGYEQAQVADTKNIIALGIGLGLTLLGGFEIQQSRKRSSQLEQILRPVSIEDFNL